MYCKGSKSVGRWFIKINRWKSGTVIHVIAKHLIITWFTIPRLDRSNLGALALSLGAIMPRLQHAQIPHGHSLLLLQGFSSCRCSSTDNGSHRSSMKSWMASSVSWACQHLMYLPTSHCRTAIDMPRSRCPYS